MTSRNCLFNTKLFFKSLFQQKYVMAVHAVLLLLSTTLFAYLMYSEYRFDGYEYAYNDAMNYLKFAHPLVVPVIVAVGVVTAFMGFSYLFKKPSSVFFGAMPVRRGSMYITKLCACFVSAVLPFIAVAIVNFVFLKSIGGDMEGFFSNAGAVILQYLLFCAVAVLGATVSGGGFAQLITVGFICLVYPVTYLVISGVIEVALETWSASFEPDLGFMFPVAYIISGELEAKHVIFSAAAALAAAVAGFFFYIKRRNENAGDFYAYRFINTVVKYYITICVALLSYILLKDMTGESGRLFPYIMGILLGVLCFVILRGIFEKSFRAMFSDAKKLVLGVLIIAIVLLVPGFDILGIDSRVGNLESVKMGAVDTNLYYDDHFIITLDSRECLDAVAGIIEAGIDGDHSDYGLRYVEFYINDNPFGLTREVEVPVSLYNNFVSEIYDSSDYKEDYIAYIENSSSDSAWNIYSGGLNREIVAGTKKKLLSALISDIKDCGFEQIKNSRILYEIGVERIVEGYGYNYGEIPVYECFEKTVSIIKENFPEFQQLWKEGLKLGWYDVNYRDLEITDEAEIGQIISVLEKRENPLSGKGGIEISVYDVHGNFVGVVCQDDLPESIKKRMN